MYNDIDNFDIIRNLQNFSIPLIFQINIYHKTSDTSMFLKR